ncbi:glucose/arabinose dehydrogenase [Povalibacter uvarum]|uniref:Glucose/arabinose dehydrogenase n=1 Tax=Povalibacter uvarum TaxID=732238 RepID=A0A841HQ64_9GAMM|nr:PQQ-dependent sugar dehydrogenase [Povalibacter uvarum]MBB6094469.1 glucose/arabinose dehydrogenase [Povalibacter uvarum]
MSRAPTILLALLASTGVCLADAPRSPTPKSVDGPLKVNEIATGLKSPWGLALLPDGRMLVTERGGQLRIVAKDGKVSAPLGGVPAVAAKGQGGLLDVTLSPSFATDNLIYLSYSEPGEDGTAGTSVARARLGDTAIDSLQVIWRQTPKTSGPNHFGSRIVFRNDGTLFITTGDRFTERPKVQDLSTTIGKVVRINADGSIPADNPFVNRGGARPEIWSYGHRNSQAAALRSDGTLWTVEHGAKGGDELNHPEAGKNYGWPVITYGVDYSGVKIGEGTEKAGMEQPVYYWDPVIAPSGAAFYSGKAFPQWEGQLFVGSMNPGGLVRLELVDGKVASETRYLGERNERIRDVQVGADGYFYLITDNPTAGKLLQVVPK